MRQRIARSQHEFWETVARIRVTQAETQAILDRMEQRQAEWRRRYRWWKPWTW